MIHHAHQREVDAKESGRCLAEAFEKGYFELPLFKHEIRQFIGRVNLIAAVMPELELPPFDQKQIRACLAQAFEGLTLAKEAQAVPLASVFVERLGKDQASWVEELAPTALLMPDGRKLKLQYAEQAVSDAGQPNSPELQVKLHECFGLKSHPRICEGRLPVKLWLCAPDGKRLEATCDWPAFKTNGYPKLKSGLQKKYPGVPWL